ncbi:MAG: RIP metalloprotease RseP [Bacillota bacterium]|nr:RIP metalloprotease RseP [Bacillota bacterium]
MQTFIASVFVFGLLILVHELGHYFVARWTGIRVLELAIGFGPKIFGWRKNEIDYSLRAIPLGGFCRMLGEGPNESSEPDSFPQKPVWSRAAVLMSGAGMNLLLAIVVFFIIFFFIVGVPVTDVSQVGYIIEDTPAEVSGLAKGDLIRTIDGLPVADWDDVVTLISARPDREIILEIERNGQEMEIILTPQLDEESGRGMIGIGPQIHKYKFFSSLRTSVDRFMLIIVSMYQVVTGQAPLDVAGPVGIIFVIGEVAQTGFVNLLMLTGLISISLGIMNLLPIPALDGGRLFFLLIEAVRGKKIDPEKEGFIHFIGFALLILLILFITYQDLLRFDILPGN